MAAGSESGGVAARADGVNGDALASGESVACREEGRGGSGGGSTPRVRSARSVGRRGQGRPQAEEAPAATEKAEFREG